MISSRQLAIHEAVAATQPCSINDSILLSRGIPGNLFVVTEPLSVIKVDSAVITVDLGVVTVEDRVSQTMIDDLEAAINAYHKELTRPRGAQLNVQSTTERKSVSKSHAFDVI